MGLHVNLQKKVNRFSLDIELEICNEPAVLFEFSGAGKSMTLQLIAGLIKPDSGVIRLTTFCILIHCTKQISLPRKDFSAMFFGIGPFFPT